MEWEQAGGQTTYIKPSQLKPGDTFEGIFVETTKDPRFGNNKHALRQDDGSIKVINGSGQLDFVMKTIPPGTKIRVVYEGKKKLESGNFKGRDANQWKVFKAKVPTDETPF